jgi:uncharacterized protein YciI
VLYAIVGDDVADSLERRLAARPAHLARLTELDAAGRLALAGPCPAIDSPDPGPAGFAGSLIVAEFDSLDGAGLGRCRPLCCRRRLCPRHGAPVQTGISQIMSVIDAMRASLAALEPTVDRDHRRLGETCRPCRRPHRRRPLPPCIVSPRFAGCADNGKTSLGV